jgi:hypothetical protein
VSSKIPTLTYNWVSSKMPIFTCNWVSSMLGLVFYCSSSYM